MYIPYRAISINSLVLTTHFLSASIYTVQIYGPLKRLFPWTACQSAYYVLAAPLHLGWGRGSNSLIIKICQNSLSSTFFLSLTLSPLLHLLHLLASAGPPASVMQPDNQSKYAIHEAAREGRSTLRRTQASPSETLLTTSQQQPSNPS